MKNVPQNSNPQESGVRQSLSGSIVFAISTICGLAVGYAVVGPILVGGIQLALDRFGSPMPEQLVRIVWIACTLVTGLVSGLTASRVVSTPDSGASPNHEDCVE